MICQESMHKLNNTNVCMFNLSVIIFISIVSIQYHIPLLWSKSWYISDSDSETGLSPPPVKYFTDRSNAVLLLWIFYVFSVLCLLCLCDRLFICALWSPAGKGLTFWFSFVVSNCEFVTFLFGILGQVWYLIVSIPDLCILINFYKISLFLIEIHVSMI